MTAAVPFPVAASLLLPVAGTAVLTVSAQVAAGEWRTYPVLAANHLLTLGWGTFVAMGALHQMFPALLGVSSKPGLGVLVQFGLTVPALAVLLYGFATSSPRWVAAGGLGVLLSVCTFLVLLLRVVPVRRRWPVAATGVCLSLVYLLITALWGSLVALNWNLRLWPALYGYAGVGLHVAFGLVGWFVQLVVSVSYYLLPRFTGVRSLSERRLIPLLVALNLAVGLFALAALQNQPGAARTATASLCLAAVLYVADLFRFLRGARQQSPDLTNWHWRAIAVQTVLAAAGAAAWALGVLPVDGRRVAASATVLFLCGWVTLAITGQLYKVTPLLMWYYRYARGLSAYEVPRLAAPYFPRWGAVAFWLIGSGSTLLGVSVLAETPALARIAGAAWAAGATVYGFGICASWIVGALLGPRGQAA
ncbi:hypothetical protein HRbin32_00155 [bacterium HR32]|jgi:hypothetical protein|nr:hypothetical protein HRbin32_00155 [bacterium HR32]